MIFGLVWGGSAALAQSPLFDKAREAAVSVQAQGTVDTKYLVSPNSLVDTEAHVSQEVFRRAAEMMAHASHEVLFQTFWWEGDSQAVQALVDGLRRLEARRRTAQAAEPVQVYILINSNLLEVWRSGMYRAAETFLTNLAAELDSAYVELHVKDHFHWALGSNHTKTLVVDGQVGIITGANAQRYLDEPDGWYDLGFSLAGDAARAMRDDFLNIWERSGGQSITKQVEDFAVPFPVTKVFSDEVVVAPALALTRQADDVYNFRINNPQDQGFLALFDQARDIIKVLSPNLNDDAAIEALAAAASRGVEVQIVLTMEFNQQVQNVIGQGGGNRVNYERLIEAVRERGGDPSRLKLRWYSLDGIEPVRDSTDLDHRPYCSHAKYTSIDGQVAVVGSANMDTQSWNHSREFNFAVDSAEVTQAWDQQTFDEVYRRSVDYRDFLE
jgi:phosphatidylserine/phosphatidylglycerophosphate/cardiolipin synthase-like enzyme